MSDSERIIVILEKLGISQKELANRIGLKPNTISMIKLGKKKLTERNMQVISKEFNINLEWIKTGEGEFRAEKDIDVLQYVFDVIKENNKEKINLITEICKMNEKDFKELLKFYKIFKYKM